MLFMSHFFCGAETVPQRLVFADSPAQVDCGTVSTPTNVCTIQDASKMIYKLHSGERSLPKPSPKTHQNSVELDSNTIICFWRNHGTWPSVAQLQTRHPERRTHHHHPRPHEWGSIPKGLTQSQGSHISGCPIREVRGGWTFPRDTGGGGPGCGVQRHLLPEVWFRGAGVDRVRHHRDKSVGQIQVSERVNGGPRDSQETTTAGARTHAEPP